MIRPFLQAHWSHLCILSYEVPAAVLTPYLPRGITLDSRDGKHFASLVAFDFDNTRVRGVSWPGFRAFPEINLRFYARRGADRGVVFVREFVPSRVIGWVARHLYNEPYSRVPMTSDVHRTSNGIEVRHTFEAQGKKQSITVAATGEPPLLPDDDGWESFFIDQQWGFGRSSSGQSVRYRVVHPRWLVHRVEWCNIRVDWARTYGPQWAFLRELKPCSTVLAEGSEVAVYPAEAA